MRLLDLFSGIGGFSLGLERAGMRTVAFCELDPFARAVLKKHWPDVPQFADVRRLTGEQVGTVDVVAGGYPCQPYSAAGKRDGARDDRHLWPEMRRLVGELRPRWVIGENVAGHITLGLDQVLTDLDGLGYTSRAFVIPACAVDAPHKRERVWIVAHAFGERGRGGNDTRQDAIHADARSKTFGAGGNGGGWATEPGVGRVANGISNRVDRLRGLGNSIVSQIAEEIGKAIMRIENEQDQFHTQ